MAPAERVKHDSSARRREGEADLTRLGQHQLGLLAILLATVAIIVLLVYWPVLSCQALSFDDQQYLTENALVQNPSWASAGRFLGEVLTPSTVQGYYQPLAMISLMLDCAMGGRPDDLRVFHRTSLLLHVLNTVLVGLLLYTLLGQGWAAAMASLLYGLHPLTIESVAWIGERKTLLAAFFALGSLLFYVQYARRKTWVCYAAALIAFVLALLAKPTSTPLPVLMLLLDYWPLNRLNRRAVVEKWPFFALAVVASVITVVSQGRTASVVMPDQHPRAAIPLVLCHNIVFYLYKTLWPANLTWFYEYPKPLALSQPAVLAGVVGTAVLIAGLLVSWRRTRTPVTGWMFFFVAIFPTMGVIGFTVVIAADRFTYLPSVGLILIAAWLIGCLWNLPLRGAAPTGPRRGSIVAVVAVLAVAEAVGTHRGLLLWQDTEKLFRHMVAGAPTAGFPRMVLGTVLAKKGQGEEGKKWLEEALTLQPELAEAHTSLGNILVEEGRLDDAIAHHREALRIWPGYVPACINLGNALARQGRTDEAIAQFLAALQRNPDSAVAHRNVAEALVRAGRTPEAVPHFSRAADLGLERAEWRIRVADALAREGRTSEAVEYYRQVLRLQPNSSSVLNNLAWVLATRGQAADAAEAVQLGRRACEATGQRDPGALDTLAAAYAAAGQYAEAVATVRKGIDLAASRGRQDLVREMSGRLLLYEAGRSYREPPSPATRPRS